MIKYSSTAFFHEVVGYLIAEKLQIYNTYVQQPPKGTVRKIDKLCVLPCPGNRPYITVRQLTSLYLDLLLAQPHGNALARC